MHRGTLRAVVCAVKRAKSARTRGGALHSFRETNAPRRARRIFFFLLQEGRIGGGGAAALVGGAADRKGKKAARAVSARESKKAREAAPRLYAALSRAHCGDALLNFARRLGGGGGGRSGECRRSALKIQQSLTGAARPIVCCARGAEQARAQASQPFDGGGRAAARDDGFRRRRRTREGLSSKSIYLLTYLHGPEGHP